jgi:hypothetical protein
MPFRSFFLLLLFVPMAAWADIRGIDLYARGEFVKALPVLREEMSNPRRTEKERIRARIYLAASMYALGMQVDASMHLEELARNHPESRVDPNRFPPGFVKMAAQARKKVADEQLAQEAEQKRLAEEAERLKREQEAAARQQPLEQPPVGEPLGEAPIETASTFQLRPEVTGFIDGTKNQAWGLGVGATLGQGMFEASLRGLIAPKWGLQLDAGLVLGSGVIRPRLAGRVTGALGLGEPKGLGLGGVVGVRLVLSPRLTLLVDTGLERFLFLPSNYKTVVWMTSAGVGFNLF